MAKLKSIAIFNPSLQLGGAERMLVVMANAFSRIGYDVALLVSVSGPLRREVAADVRLIEFQQRGVMGALLPLRAFLRAERPDILFSAQSHANLVALLARRLARVDLPVVIGERTAMSLHFSLEPGLKNRLIPKLARVLYHQADAVVCISQGVADDIMAVTKVASERVHTIYNPALPPRAALEAQIGQSLEHPWFRPDAPPVVLAVGRLTTAKDYPTLLRAFDHLRREQPARLLILGDGEQRAELEALIETLSLTELVQMPGFVDNPYAYMARCACFVLSSAWEGFANVLVEALACGAPIVATNCNYGPAEILQAGKYGLMTPVGDDRSMSAAMQRVLAGDAAWDKSGLRERARDFALEPIAQQYLDVFRALIDVS